MATAIEAERTVVPELQFGDRLTRQEFERRYDAMPRLKKAELVEGMVYIPSPVSLKHSKPHAWFLVWLGVYQAATPGVECADNSSVRLDMDNEPQPDALMRILPERGGRSRTEDGYVAGPPELVVEVAASSASYDLHDKLNAYRRNGVREYLVHRVEERAVDWFALREGRYERLPEPEAGILQSQVFPGLRLNVAAFLRGDVAGVLSELQKAIGSEEHKAFVARLGAEK